MSTSDWKRELQRLLEVFERESTISLKEIKRCFDASGLSFDENFRKYFKKVSTLRLDTSFDAVLFDSLLENQMPNAPINDASDHNEASIEPKMEHDAGDPIEIADSDDEGSDEQQTQIVNDSTESGPIEEDDDDENRDGENDERTGVCIEVNVKHVVNVEAKSEIQLEMDELPMVQFDPIKANEATNVQMNIAEAETLNVQQQQPSSSSNAQKRLEHGAGKRFRCTDCAYTSEYKFTLKRHLRIHESIKPFKCSHCDYASRRKDDLTMHQKVHVREKLMGVVQNPSDGLYKCMHCDRRFTQIRFLSTHVTQTHMNDQRLFNCSRCMRRFIQETEKQSHELGCKSCRFECYLCKKYVTKNKTNMQTHMRIHSGAKPFGCMICNQHFGRKYHVKRHLNSVHGRKHK